MQIEFPLDDPDRLKALEASGLTSSSPNEELDRLAQIACSTIACPVALVSLVESDRQLFPGQAGLPEPVATARDTPLSHPFCQQVVTSREPLIVENAREHPALNANPAIEALDVVAYAGVPIILRGGAVAGSFCAIDTKPRKWSEADLGVLRALSAVTTLLVRSGDRLAAQTAAKDEIADGRYRLAATRDRDGGLRAFHNVRPERGSTASTRWGSAPSRIANASSCSGSMIPPTYSARTCTS